MDFFKSMKDKIFGFTEDPQPPQQYQQDIDDFNNFNTPQGDDFGFRVFSNPLEMHRYFERQMGEIFKSFGMPQSDGPFLGGNSPTFGAQIDETPNTAPLRDQYLKPGFEKPRGNYRGDEIINGHVDVGELDAVIKPEQGVKITPRFNAQFFGQSISSSIVTKSDGITEIHRTIRDGRGNEQVTVTKKCGDKEYTVVTKTDSSGQQEIRENITNMDEKEVELFKNHKDLPSIISDSNRDIFDKLFG